MCRYFKKVIGVSTGSYIYFWKSKRLPHTSPSTSDYSPNPQLSYTSTKTRQEFRGSCLKQDKIVFDHQKVIKIYIVYELIKYLKKINKKKELIKKDKIYVGFH